MTSPAMIKTQISHEGPVLATLIFCAAVSVLLILSFRRPSSLSVTTHNESGRMGANCHLIGPRRHVHGRADSFRNMSSQTSGSCVRALITALRATRMCCGIEMILSARRWVFLGRNLARSCLTEASPIRTKEY